MKLSTKLFSLAALVAGGLFLTSLTTATDAQEKKPQRPDSEMPAGMPEMDAAMMARMMELATPGPEHAELAKMAGKHETTYRMNWGGGGEWMEQPATIEGRMILGGRYLLEEHKSEMMGMPFEGLMLIGFDQEAKEYVSLWADNWSTWWAGSRGTKGADGAVEMKGEMKDIMGKRPFRSRMKVNADGSVDHEMFDTIDGKEVQVMTYTTKPMAKAPAK